MIERLADAGIPVDNSCTVLGVSRQGYYRYKAAPGPRPQLRRQWLGVHREIPSPPAAPTATGASTPS